MKRVTLLLTCVAIIAATSGCRCGGDIFNWRSSNSGCCGPVESISPTVSNYEPSITYEGPYDSGAPVMVQPSESLPTPAPR
ncbi:hypothetical protein GC197_00755 [bacterium]|nr:hypothetical protein [bacterium]